MTLRNVRDYIATLGIAEDGHCYCGKMPDKKDKSIGAYPLKQGHPTRIPLGGMDNASYGEKAVLFLVHWNRSPSESEEAAARLQEALMRCREEKTDSGMIKFILLSHGEPIPVGTDEGGIYEYVLEAAIYHEKDNGNQEPGKENICQ